VQIEFKDSGCISELSRLSKNDSLSSALTNPFFLMSKIVQRKVEKWSFESCKTLPYVLKYLTIATNSKCNLTL